MSGPVSHQFALRNPDGPGKKGIETGQDGGKVGLHRPRNPDGPGKKGIETNGGRKRPARGVRGNPDGPGKKGIETNCSSGVKSFVPQLEP